MRKAALLSSPFTRPRVEELEPRHLLSVYTPAQLRHAYGFDHVRNDGTGQTIAIVDAYDDPTIASDLRTFDSQFNLPAASLIKSVPQGQPPAKAAWSEEIALDVEWAHAIAPGATLLLVEAKSSSVSDLMAAVNWARQVPTVSVVAMSWGVDEFAAETGFDPNFLTPLDHSGVTFVASSGDSGTSVNWPAASPNVVAVGGTTLTLADASGTYGSEKGWSGSGGLSAYERRPSYQNGVQGSAWRTDPDVAYNADPKTAVYVYDSSAPRPGWFGMGGTSAGVPQWAGLLALANQARAQAGKPSLDGPSQTLPALYAMSASNFNDVTSGGNGFSAHIGYDFVTGRGTPRAPALIAALAGAGGSASAASQGLSTASAARAATQPARTAANRSGFDAYPSLPAILLAPIPTTAARQTAAGLPSSLAFGPSARLTPTLVDEGLAGGGTITSGEEEAEEHVSEQGKTDRAPPPAAPQPAEDDGLDLGGSPTAPAGTNERPARETERATPQAWLASGNTTVLASLFLLLSGYGDGREELAERRRMRNG